MKKTISTIIYFLKKSIPVLLFVFSSAPIRSQDNLNCTKIEIFDSAGIKVKEADTMKRIIDIQDLKTGFYIIQLTGSEQKIIKKLIVLK